MILQTSTILLSIIFLLKKIKFLFLQKFIESDPKKCWNQIIKINWNAFLKMYDIF